MKLFLSTLLCVCFFSSAVYCEKNIKYVTFFISSPSNNASLFNLPKLHIQTSLSPNLAPKDTIQFYYDGSPIGCSSQKTIIFIPRVTKKKQFLVRGSHTIYASIMDKNGDIIKRTPVITVFLHYSGVNNK